MTRLDSYIARNVMVASLAVVFLIVGLDFIFSLMSELDRLRGGYQFAEALQYITLRLPRRLHEYLPIACLIGCLAGLGAMAASSELTVMRAAGISVARISVAVLKPMAVLMLIGLLLAEFVIPPLERIAQSQKAVAMGRGEALSNSGKGYWHREQNQFMRFRAVEPNGVLHGITLYDFNDEQELQQVRMAKRAIYQRSYWQMEGVVDVFIHPERTELRRTGTAEWHTNLSPQSLAVVMVQPRDMSISDLYSYTRYLQQQGLDADSYLLSFWRKVTQPLGTFALVILGISFIFGPLRSVTPGYRIFSGILVGLIYKYSEDLLAPASILFGIDPIWASILPISGCLLAGIIVMRRAG